MATLLEQLSYLNDTKELIKQAIENKGVEVPNRTTFREYPDKIDEIINEYVPEWTVNTAGAFTSVILKDKLIFPTEVNGQAMSTTFNYTGTYESLWPIKKLIWPEHFLNVNFNTIFQVSTTTKYSLVEEIECNATVISGNNIENLVNLKRFYLPKYQGNINLAFHTGYTPITDTFLLDAPEANGRYVPKVGISSKPISLELNLPKITQFGVTNPSYSSDYEPGLQYCTGEWTLPSVTRFSYYKIPSQEQTLKLPAITIQDTASSFNTGGSGILHLYLGPNMASCACAANWVSHAQNIDIHIPAGDSTTKATLDAAGVAYTQDYVI